MYTLLFFLITLNMNIPKSLKNIKNKNNNILSNLPKMLTLCCLEHKSKLTIVMVKEWHNIVQREMVSLSVALSVPLPTW